ncbi:purine-nucleoside phosphorylase [Clostridium sp. AWRP]|uniref:purine-nucleoside phosphorylase n=1 Tax=Clostridium sp. AWRP TaxID=2212991 RepID=UPI000FDA75C7|nr:purine-nucleoside phosphorylase [Clostridium sp. AWRP]AZV57013.1 purine-nucleoside phosphorylase [Clostridium sp. AWRP]
MHLMFKQNGTNLNSNIEEAAIYINSGIKVKPEIALILGSGLGHIADEIEDKKIYPYSEIPNFPISTVEGHKSCLVIGKLQGKVVAAMQGRFHYYEGYSMKEVTFPIRVMKMLGIQNLIVTNAAGGINKSYRSGDLMLIRDHLNLSGQNPLIGQNLEKFGPRFPDMSEAYDSRLREMVKRVAGELHIPIQEGVYAYMSGPSYETPAEIKMLSVLGGDAVGMSTVPEVIVANHSDMRIIGISCITNMAAGILKHALNHEEVIKNSLYASEKFTKLIKAIIENI